MGDIRFFGSNDRCRQAGPSAQLPLTAIRSGTLLTTALLLGLAVPAEAQFFWPDERPDPVRVERKRVHYARQRAPKAAEVVKETSKPAGPVIIAISIEKQQLKIYDNNGVFAESPVSTGMPGHATPMGVFSVIGKEVFHRSNIYSGAPMPHMQRITWSGVAMHAGVLPGRPASHGCIRLPPAFATRMFGWTKMGARVIITPGEMSPAEFSHQRLIAQKPESSDPNMPVASTKSAETAPKAGKVDVGTPSSASELRLTSATGGGAGTRKSDEIRTADASGAVPSKPEPQTGKDEVRAQDGDKAIASPPAPRPLPGTAEFIGPVKPRTGQIAAFVSRKENKLYVRQNFVPLFDVPVTIATGDKPLGTHVFTVRSEDDKDRLQWTVISLPAPPPRAAKRAQDESPRRKKIAVAEPAAPQTPSTAAEALDRIAIPDEAMKRIAAALSPGGSLVVSDQGLGDETGSGTDFIVHLR